MKQQLKFRISPDGSKVEVEGIGFKGRQCLQNDLTKGVLDALGTVEKTQKKKEYYSTVESGTKIRG